MGRNLEANREHYLKCSQNELQEKLRAVSRQIYGEEVVGRARGSRTAMNMLLSVARRRGLPDNRHPSQVGLGAEKKTHAGATASRPQEHQGVSGIRTEASGPDQRSRQVLPGGTVVYGAVPTWVPRGEQESREREPVQKQRIIVSSDRATLREIKAALNQVGGFEAFIRAAGNSRNEADWWDLWGELRRHLEVMGDRHALDDTELCLLQRHAGIVAAMNADPDFPYTIDFLGKASLQVKPDEYSVHELTAAQRWYLLGIEHGCQGDRARGDADAHWKPPGETEHQRPYRAGWTGRGSDVTRWFPSKAQPQHEVVYTEEGAPVSPARVEKREIRLSPAATIAEICAAFPGGIQQLKIALHREGARMSAGDIEYMAQSQGDASALRFFEERGLWDGWLAAHLGIRFED